MKNRRVSLSADGKYEIREIRSAIPLWIAAGVWLLFGLFAPMYKLACIILAAILSAAAGAAAEKLLPKETVTEEIPFASGDEKLDSAVRSLEQAQTLLKKDADDIRPHSLKTAKTLTETAVTLGEIQAELIKDPSCVKKLRRFFDYYLPTDVKLADKYTAMITTSKKGENYENTLAATENALMQLNNAFRKQYDMLYQDDSMDAQTDLTVLETLLKQDDLYQ